MSIASSNLVVCCDHLVTIISTYKLVVVSNLKQSTNRLYLQAALNMFMEYNSIKATSLEMKSLLTQVLTWKYLIIQPCHSYIRNCYLALPDLYFSLTLVTIAQPYTFNHSICLLVVYRQSLFFNMWKEAIIMLILFILISLVWRSLIPSQLLLAKLEQQYASGSNLSCFPISRRLDGNKCNLLE